MFCRSEIIPLARETLRTEGEAILALSDHLDESFIRLVEMMNGMTGKVILTGVGKSALIARKMVASLNSTGTPAAFLHSGDAIHGDLGIIQPGDLVLFLSKSGNTPEIKVLVPIIKSSGIPILALVSDPGSYLEQHADLSVRVPFDREACPDNLVPTTSTTLQSAIGDAIVICLLKTRGYSKADYARVHPGGTIGKRLYLKVSDLYVLNERPQVNENTAIREVIVEISSKRLGATAVSGSSGEITGIITDGDLRRMMQKYDDTRSLFASDIMTRNPRCIEPDEPAARALEIMRAASITQLLVLRNGSYLGVIHIHDILREGII